LAYTGCLPSQIWTRRRFF